MNWIIIWLWLCDISPAREDEKLKMKKQNEALTAERKHLEQRAAQLAESLSVSDHCCHSVCDHSHLVL